MTDFDVIVVGAGCAGSVAAYEIANRGKSVLLIERGINAGSKNMTGGRLYTHSLAKVFPDFEQEAPLERKVTHELISFITEDEVATVELSSAKLKSITTGSYTVLRAQFDSWLASKAEEAGAEIVYGMTVDGLLREENRVTGVSVSGDEITAKIVILADGANSILTKEVGLSKKISPTQMAVCAKEVISLPVATINERFHCTCDDGSAWLFAGAITKGHPGGGFIYTNKDTVSIGLVATMSGLIGSSVPFSEYMNDFKLHPAIAPLIEGGKTVEYSGHIVPEGGYNMVGSLYGDGILVTGDSGMLCVNLGYQVRGMDYAIASGFEAGRVAAEAVDANDVSSDYLKRYRDALESSFVLKDLKSYKKFPEFMEQTQRLYNDYPQMITGLLRSMFIVDGEPVSPMKTKVTKQIKNTGVITVLKDVKKVVDAL